MDFDETFQFSLDHDDDLFPEPEAEEPLDANAILSRPIPQLEQQGDIFEEWLDENPLSVEGEYPPEEDYNQRYALIFQEMEEGELTSDELIQNLNAWVDDEPLSSGPLSQGIPVESTLDTGAAPGWTGGGGVATPAVSGDAGASGQVVTGAETGGEGASEAVAKTDLSSLPGAGAAAIAAGAGALLNEALKREQGSEPEAQWYYSADGKQYGPLFESELKQKLRSGAFSGQGYVWREGMKAWQSAATAGLVPASGVNSADSAGRQCPSCHQPLAAGDRFCGKCGTKV